MNQMKRGFTILNLMFLPVSCFLPAVRPLGCFCTAIIHPFLHTFIRVLARMHSSHAQLAFSCCLLALVRLLQATVEYFAITAMSMFVQQYSLRFKVVRDYIGLPAEWPHIGAKPVKVGTHPLAKFLDGNMTGGSGTADSGRPEGEKPITTFMTVWGPQQPTPPGPPPGASAAELRAASAAVFASAAANAATVAGGASVASVGGAPTGAPVPAPVAGADAATVVVTPTSGAGDKNGTPPPQGAKPPLRVNKATVKKSRK